MISSTSGGRRRLVLTLALLAVVVAWPVTGSVATAAEPADAGVTVPPAPATVDVEATVSPIPAPATGDASRDRLTWVVRVPQEDEDCVLSSSGAYPDTFQVTCEVVDGNESIRVSGQGGWAYIVYMNASRTTVLNLDFQSQTTVNETVQAGDLAFVGAISIERLTADTIRETWRSKLQVDRSEVGIAVQSNIVGEYVPGSDPPKAKFFRPLPGGVVAKPGPGTYRLRLVAYEQTPPIAVQQGSTTDALRSQTSAAIENAPTKTASVVVDVGCESELDTERTRAKLLDQQQNVRAETKQAAADYREGRQTGGEAGADAAASGSPNGAMTADLAGTGEGGPSGALEAARSRESSMSSAFGALDEIQAAYESGKRTVREGVDEVLDRWARIPKKDATEAVTGALAEEGVSPPAGSSLDLEDYVSIGAQRSQRDGFGRGTRTARIRIGPNGNILPTPENLPDVNPCEDEYLQKSTEWLKLEFFKLPGGDYDVQAQRIDVATSEITDAEYVGWNERNTDIGELVDNGIDGVGGVAGATDGTVSGESGESERIVDSVDSGEADATETTGDEGEDDSGDDPPPDEGSAGGDGDGDADPGGEGS